MIGRRRVPTAAQLGVKLLDAPYAHLARAAADQLGHAKVSMTQDHYFGRRVVVTGAARVLEELNGRPASDAEN